MRLRTLIAIAVTMCALPAVAGELPTAPMPRTAHKAQAFRLRNIAAADAADAVGAFLKARNLDAVLVAEPVSNTVLLSAEPALKQQLLDILIALDKEPTQVVVQVIAVKVPDTFVKKSGLDVGAAPGATSWTLTARELHMLTELLRASKERGECEVLSCPRMSVLDNQTGFVQVGQDHPVISTGGAKPTYMTTGFTFRTTPRVMPDGGVLLRAEAQITEKGAPVALATTVPGFPYPLTQLVPCFNTQTVQATTGLKAGETFVTRVGETLVIVTPSVVKK